MERSEQDWALAWKNAATEEKIILFKSHPDRQRFFMNLPGDKVMLLARLPNQEAIIAFAHIKQHEIREAILQRLTSESRQRVIEAWCKPTFLKDAILMKASPPKPSDQPEQLSALPTELVAAIARYIPNLWNFMCTSRRHFEVGGDIWVRQVMDGGDIRRSCIALLCISHWGRIEHLARHLCKYAGLQMVRMIREGALKMVEPILKDISRLLLRVNICVDAFMDVVTALHPQLLAVIKNLDGLRAFSALRSLKLAPINKNILDGYLSDVVTTIGKNVTEGLDWGDVEWQLILIGHFPSDTKISKDDALDILAAIELRAVGHIRHAEFHLARIAARLIEALPPQLDVPDETFRGLTTAIRSSVVRYLRKQDDDLQARWALECLPANIAIPEDGFLDIVTAIRERAAKRMQQAYGVGAISYLCLLTYLPHNTVPKDFFVEFVAMIRPPAVQFLENIDGPTRCNICEARQILRVLCYLPSNTTIANDYFFDVVQAIRARAIRHIAESKPQAARDTLELIRHLTPQTSIPKDYFLEAITSSTISLIKQATYNTTVSDDILSTSICYSEAECISEAAGEVARERECLGCSYSKDIIKDPREKPSEHQISLERHRARRRNCDRDWVLLLRSNMPSC